MKLSTSSWAIMFGGVSAVIRSARRMKLDLIEKSVATVAALILGCGDPAHAASLLDGSVSITNYSPNLSTVYAGPVFGVTTSSIYLAQYSFSFSDDQIIFVNPYCCTWGSPTPVDFGGFVLSFSGTPAIESVSNDVSSEMTPKQLYTSGNDVFIGFTAGAPRYSGQTGVFDIQFKSAVPEPETWALMIVGLGLAGVVLRRRRTSVAA